MKLGNATQNEAADSKSQSIMSHHAITLLTQGQSNPFVAKTAISMLRYRNSDILAVLDDQATGATAGELFGFDNETPVVKQLPQAAASDALYIGIAPPGGKLPPQWKPIILSAIERRMDVVSGLHDFLNRDSDYVTAAKNAGVKLIDVRKNEFATIASGQPFRRGCLRILGVGQDCSVGKMVAALEINLGLLNRGLDSTFLATGQTGIMIMGNGIPIDCVIADFVNGAAEQLVREHEQHDYVVVEGQGSISHPAFSAVTLGLLHGSRPDGMVFCYEAGRKQVKGLQDVDLPSIASQMECYLTLGNIQNPSRFVGFAVNTRNLNSNEAKDEINRIEQEFSLPACDVYRDGADKLVAAVVDLKQKIEKAQ